MPFRKIISVYSDSHMKHAITFYEKNAELFNVKVGACSYYCASNG
jgi:hypothetical protein